jgi:hypothetical protein
MSLPTSPTKQVAAALEGLDPEVAALLLQTRRTAMSELLKRGKLGWESIYAHNVNHEWENDSACPTLCQIDQEGVLPKNGRFLVPGCGAGVDVFQLAQEEERMVMGLDVVESCISYCKQVRLFGKTNI